MRRFVPRGAPTVKGDGNDAEVEELRVNLDVVAAAMKKDVLRFYVTVNHPASVGVFQRVERFTGNGERMPNIELFPAIQGLSEGPPPEELHHEIGGRRRAWRLGQARGEDLNDVGVGQPRQRLRLPRKALTKLFDVAGDRVERLQAVATARRILHLVDGSEAGHRQALVHPVGRPRHQVSFGVALVGQNRVLGGRCDASTETFADSAQAHRAGRSNAKDLGAMITVVAGTRPNFMKVAPILRALAGRKAAVRLVHTGQHFDAAMSDVFFRDLGMQAPDARLTAGGGTHAEQTAAVLVGVERELSEHRPDVLIVVGDVTSTLAAALAASKLGIPVVHVEAGLRSGDWRMPEEINRVLTDRLSDLLLTPSHDAEPNLRGEGIEAARVVFVGNVMIDSLHYAKNHPTDAIARFALKPGAYALATLHRPANVDAREPMERTLDALAAIAARVPLLFPVHPRTVARAVSLGLEDRMRGIAGLRLTEPIGYNDFVTLMASAALVATDSGGIQEETTALGVPCLTMREGTERPITVTEGTNTVVALDRARIAEEVDAIVAGRGKKGRIPEGWDGHAGERIADAVLRFLAGTPPPKTSGPRA